MPHNKIDENEIYLINLEPILTKTLNEFLINLGYKVWIFPSIRKLLCNIQNHDKTKMLIIIYLGSQNGMSITYIQQIHELCSHALFIIVSDDPPKLSVEQALSFGVFGYLHKPISLAELELLLIRIREKNLSI